MLVFVFLLFVNFATTTKNSITPSFLTVILNQPTNFSIRTVRPIWQDFVIYFKKQPFVRILTPLELHATSGEGLLQLVGERAVNELLLNVENCVIVAQNNTSCNAEINDPLLKISVLKSSFVAFLVIVVGWLYFTAWSVSFYPQILLNIHRKSVIGLNFDFLLLNIIGFAAYSVYNLLMYFDSNVQRQYEEAHPHSPIPVLLNDVFFAVHALIACILTAAQCLIYEHGNQRISHTCIIISAAMIVGAIVTAVITTLGFINMLFFITTLSYIKMIVTLLKYIPQAVQNFRRQSTTGWSIGNVLLDFMGGCLDILQMCLQCWNVDDWSAFYGNPVKFGLGLVSTLFDILFITQHYILYRDKDRSSNIKKSCHLTAGISENEDFDCEQENDVQSSKRSCDDKSLSQNKNDS